MSESYLEIQLDQQPIELCKLLKVADLVAGGGEAKVVISEGYVLLNGEVEYQKRKKVYHNDIVEFNGETLQIIVNEDLKDSSEAADEDNNTSTYEPPLEKVKQEAKASPDSTIEDTTKKSRRKPISF